MTTNDIAPYARLIAQVLAHIERHLDEDLTIETLSAVAHSSPSHFHRRFSALTGIAVGRLVRLLRLRRASLQLAFHRRATVTTIAYDAGFANAESFSRAFRKETGQTPSAFRQCPQWSAWQVRTNMVHIRQEHPHTVESGSGSGSGF